MTSAIPVSARGNLAEVLVAMGVRVARERAARAFFEASPRVEDLAGWVRVRAPGGVLVGLVAPRRGSARVRHSDPARCDLVLLGGRLVPPGARALLADLLGLPASPEWGPEARRAPRFGVPWA